MHTQNATIVSKANTTREYLLNETSIGLAITPPTVTGHINGPIIYNKRLSGKLMSPRSLQVSLILKPHSTRKLASFGLYSISSFNSVSSSKGILKISIAAKKKTRWEEANGILSETSTSSNLPKRKNTDQLVACEYLNQLALNLKKALSKSCTGFPQDIYTMPTLINSDSQLFSCKASPEIDELGNNLIERMKRIQCSPEKVCEEKKAPLQPTILLFKCERANEKKGARRKTVSYKSSN